MDFRGSFMAIESGFVAKNKFIKLVVKLKYFAKKTGPNTRG